MHWYIRIWEHVRRPVSLFRIVPRIKELGQREHYARSGGVPSDLAPLPSLVLGRMVTIHMLPDDVLLGVFEFYRGDNEYCTPKIWNRLAHVCQRWRYIVFASSRRLHLFLVCDVRTPVKKLLEIWPPLPIAIHYLPKDKGSQQNIMAALEYHSRISWVVFEELTNLVLERFSLVMQKPFPELIGLHLQSSDEFAPIIPDVFLGGSAPQLQTFFLEGIAFLALPQLLVSATHLTKLWLRRLPDAGYVEPEALATCLAALPKLEELHIGFQAPRFRLLQTIPPPPPRTILPALTYFAFRGDSKYFEDLISRMRAPNLDDLNIWFFMDIVFAIPQLHNFISSAEMLRLPKRANVELYPWSARVTLGSPSRFVLGTSCDRLAERVLWTARLCTALSCLLSHVERLDINGYTDSQVDPQDGMESSPWLKLFRPFTAVQGLCVSRKLVPFVSHTLQELKGERATEVLPALRNIFLGGLQPCGPAEEVIKSFVVARRLSDRPVVVERWKQDLYWDSVDDYSDGMEDVEEPYM